MGLFGKNFITTYTIKHVCGIPNILQEATIEVAIDEKEKTITFSHFKGMIRRKLANQAVLALSKINSVSVEASGQSYSVVTKRSHKARNTIVGGLVAGPVGAIIGSNTGNQQSTQFDLMSISINFSSDNGDKTIKLTEVPGYRNAASSMSNLISRNLTGFSEEQSVTL